MVCQLRNRPLGSPTDCVHLYDYRVIKGTNPMLKANVLKTIGSCEAAQEYKLTRTEKFAVFCEVCDNLLKEGRISAIQHERWTNVF